MAGERLVFAGTPKRRRIIAGNLFQKEAGPELEEVEANARLIAAAPDLLEGCKTALNHLEGDEPGFVCDVAEILRLTIAQAEESER